MAGATTRASDRLASSDAATTVGLIAVANAVLYGFSIGAARLLDVADYGQFAGMYALIALTNVIVAALQLSTAQRVAADPDHPVGPDATSTLAAAAVVFAVVFGAMLALADGIAVVLLASAALVAAAYVPWNIVTGIYQGQNRMIGYGSLMLGQSVTRLAALFVLAIAAEPEVLMAATAVAMFPPLLEGLRQLRLSADAARIRVSWGGLGQTTVVATAMGFVTLGDVAMVSLVHDHESGGVYAAVALLGRVVVFIPTALGPVYFPTFVRLTADGTRRRAVLVRVTAVSGAVSAALAVAIAVAPDLAIGATVGDAYRDGTTIVVPYMLASWTIGVATLVAHERLAMQDRRFVWGIAAPVLTAMVFASGLAGSPRAAAWWMAVLGGVVLVGAVTRSVTSDDVIDLRRPADDQDRVR
ncbi:MAG: hypothetical protein AAGA90_00515 [Actinomycetota bacterium]